MKTRRINKTNKNTKKKLKKKGGNNNLFTQENMIEKCNAKLGSNVDNIKKQKINNLCDIINGKLVTSIENKSYLKRLENYFMPNNKKILQEFMWAWYSYGYFSEEILKTIKSENLCFLHPIAVQINILDNDISFMYKIKNKTTILDYDMFIETEIETCKSNTMAIPLNIYITKNNKKITGHQNIILIKMKENNLEIELFDPNGETDEEIFNKENEQLFYENIKTMIETMMTKIHLISNVTFIKPNDNCIINNNIQKYFSMGDVKYGGSCQYASMLYAIKRVIYPEMSREQILDDLNKLFINKNKEGKLAEFVHQLIYNLIDLLDINYNYFTITNTRGKSKKITVMNDILLNPTLYRNKLDLLNNNRENKYLVEEYTNTINSLIEQYNDISNEYQIIYKKLLSDLLYIIKNNDETYNKNLFNEDEISEIKNIYANNNNENKDEIITKLIENIINKNDNIIELGNKMNDLEIQINDYKEVVNKYYKN